MSSYVSVPLPCDSKVAYVPLDASHLFPSQHAWRWSPEHQNLVSTDTREVFPLEVAVHDPDEIFYRGAVHPRSVKKSIETFLESMRITREKKGASA